MKNQIPGPQLSLIALASLLAVHGSLYAQSPAPAAQVEATPTVQRVIVTGSQIRRVDAEGALPVQVITAEDIVKSGKVTVTEVLQTLSASGSNGLTDSSSFSQFAYGASGVSLRGMGPTATLVLINGRRIAPYSVPDSNRGSTSFVNIDSIPMSAVSRIEVLKDGASAIYGSDAMAGVVNIILRNDYSGTEIDANVTSDREGEFGSQWAGFSMGRGSVSKDGWNLMLSAELYRRNQVMLRDVADRVIDARHRDNPDYYTGRPYYNSFSHYPNLYSVVAIDPVTGVSNRDIRSIRRADNCPSDNSWAFNNVFSPPLNLCGYSVWDDVQYVTPQQRAAVFTKGEWAINSEVTLFGEASVARLTNKQRGRSMAFGAGLEATPNGRDGGFSPLPTYLPVGHPNNPFPDQPAGIQYSFDDVGKTGIDVSNTAVRLLGGARGTWDRFDWEAGLLYAVDKTNIKYLNRISLPALRDAVLSGGYNFFDPTRGSITANNLRVEPTDKGESSFTQFDARLSGSITQLSTGSLDFASGLELRREEREYRSDDRLYAGEVYQQVASRSSGQRSVGTIYTELDLPLMRSLRAQLAARADRYSDYGGSVTPKLALAWKADEKLKVRASASKGFRAPSLVESAKTNFPEFSSIGSDPKRCGDWNVDCDGYSVSGVLRANPDLKPETSRSYTVGFVLEPQRGYSLALDVWKIDRRDEIGSLDLNEIVRNEDSSNPLFANRLRRAPADTTSVPGESIPGRITAVERQFVNRGQTQVQGVDIDLQAQWRYSGTGDLRAGANFTYIDHSRNRSTRSDPWDEYAGSMNNPRVRGNVTVEWAAPAWNVGTTINYLSGFSSVYLGDSCSDWYYLNSCKVSDYVTVDLFAGWDVTKQLHLYGNVRNALNSRMPFSPTDQLGNSYWYSPTGPSVRLGARYEF